MVKKRQKRAKRYERKKAKDRRGKHLGGPGQADYQRGLLKGEVKNWKRPVHSGVIKNALKKGVKEINSKGGFTQPAIELARRKGVKPIVRNQPIT